LRRPVTISSARKKATPLFPSKIRLRSPRAFHLKRVPLTWPRGWLRRRKEGRGNGKNGWGLRKIPEPPAGNPGKALQNVRNLSYIYNKNYVYKNFSEFFFNLYSWNVVPKLAEWILLFYLYCLYKLISSAVGLLMSASFRQWSSCE